MVQAGKTTSDSGAAESNRGATKLDLLIELTCLQVVVSKEQQRDPVGRPQQVAHLVWNLECVGPRPDGLSRHSCKRVFVARHLLTRL